MAYRDTSIIIFCFICIPFVVPQTMPHITYEIQEGVARGTLVGNVRQDSGLVDRYDANVFNSLRFSIMLSSGTLNQEYTRNVLALDEVTGELITLGDLDREWLCSEQRDTNCDTLSLRVSVKPFKYYSIIRVDVRVLDINDNSPTFPAMDYKFVEWTVKETARVGDRFLLPSAEDLDSGVNGIQRYELLDPSGHFAVNYSLSADTGITSLGRARRSTGDVYLVIASSLDRETTDFYSLTVIAWDGGSQPRSGILLVHVVVIDNNDNRPVCAQEPFEAYISEYASAGEEIVRVYAYDADAGINGRVRYKLDNNSYPNMFFINELTGIIRLANAVDYEFAAKYDLFVIAADGDADNEQRIYCHLIVYALDENDNAPVINVKTSSDVNYVTVRENLPPNTVAAIVTVSDADKSPNNGDFACSLLSEGYFIISRVSTSEFQIITNASFDRENRSHYALSMTCRDFGQPSLTSTRNLTVIIDDVNDNVPVFSLPIYKVQLRENNPIDSVVLITNASDADDTNNEIRYQIKSVHADDANTLEIDVRTGLVRTKVVFDYEMRVIHRYIVEATDNGLPARKSSVMLILEITDSNDNAPIFIQPNYTFIISEFAPVNAGIGIIRASDADSYPFNVIVYSLERATYTPFNIDTRTGAIFIRKPLNKGIQLAYNLRAIANNRGFPDMKSFCNVSIIVSPEEAPVAQKIVNVEGELTTTHKTVQSESTTKQRGVMSTYWPTLKPVDVNESALFVQAVTSLAVADRHFSWSNLLLLLYRADIIIAIAIALLFLLILILLIRCCCLPCCKRKSAQAVEQLNKSETEVRRPVSGSIPTHDDVITALNSIVKLGATLDRLEKERIRTELQLPLYSGHVSRSCDLTKTTRLNQVTI